MAFEGLTAKLNAAFKKLRGKGRLSESDIKEAMREIRLALLEADVSYKVVKDFVKSVSERCSGQDVQSYILFSNNTYFSVFYRTNYLRFFVWSYYIF